MMALSGGAADQPERRSGERIDILGDLRGEIMVYQTMSVRDISPGGALVETAYPLQIDSLHEVRLQLGESAVIVKGRVVHCSISDVDRETVMYQSGLEFVQPSAGVSGVIVHFVEAIKAGRLAR
jgi:hypothetical protein